MQKIKLDPDHPCILFLACLYCVDSILLSHVSEYYKQNLVKKRLKTLKKTGEKTFQDLVSYY